MPTRLCRNDGAALRSERITGDRFLESGERRLMAKVRPLSPRWERQVSAHPARSRASWRRSPDRADIGRSTLAAGTPVHAPFPTFTQTSSNHRVGWTTNLRLARTQSVRGRNQTDPDCLRANMPGSRCPNPQRCGHPQIDRLPGSIVRRARHCR